MFVRRFGFDLSTQNFRFWKIAAFVLGGLNLIENCWLFYEIVITPEPLESNAAYIYVSVAYVLYGLRWILGIVNDFIEVFIKVLVGQFEAIFFLIIFK